MRLESRNGAFVELRVARPEAGPAGGADPGVEGVVVEGVVDAGDGRAWMFGVPCLTRAEARLLGDWLLRAAKGRVELLERLTFTAPELTFMIDEHEYGQPRLTIGFSLTAAPSWLGGEQLRTFDYPVTLDLSSEALESAAVDWERELSRL